MLHLATSAEHVAVACSSGEIRLYAAGSLDLAGVVPALPQAAAPSGGTWPEACAFSRDGQTLTASYSGGQLVTWDVRDLSQPTITHLRQFHRCVCEKREQTPTPALVAPVPLACRSSSSSGASL